MKIHAGKEGSSNNFSFREELSRFLEAHRSRIIEIWADMVMHIPEFKKAHHVTKDAHLQAMSEFLPLMALRLRDNRSREASLFLESLTQSGFIGEFKPSTVIRGHLALKKAISGLLKPKYSADKVRLEWIIAILEQEIETHLETIIDTYHKASEKKWSRLQNEAEQTKGFLENVIKSSIDGITTTDKKGKITFASGSTENLLGYEPEEILGIPVSKYYAGGVEEARKIMNILREKGYLRNYELHIIRKDGSHVPVNLSASLLRNGKGEVIGTLGIFRDITEMKQAEDEIRKLFDLQKKRSDQLEALREIGMEILGERDLEELLYLVIKKAAELIQARSGCIYIWDEEAQLLIPRRWFNLGDWIRDVRIRIGEGTSGLAALRQKGMIINDYLNSPYKIKAFVEHAIFSSIAQPMVSKGKLIGVITLNDANMGRSFDEEDLHLLSMFANQATVAIENAQLFFELRRREAELRRERDFTKTLIDSMGEGLDVLDARGRITFANKKFYQMLGYRPEELLGRPWEILFHPEDLDVARKNFEKRLKGQTVRYECRMLRKDGTSIPVILTGTPILDIDGRSKETIGMFTDISERKKNEEEIKQKNEELENFVFTISHDLKSPIISLHGFCGILMEEYKDKLDEMAQHYLNKVQDNISKIELLIHDLLDLSRIGRVENVYQEVDISSLIQEVLEGFQFSLEKKRIRLSIQKDLPIIICDRGRISRVFENLISNAIKYQADGLNPMIEIGCREKAHYFELYVKDNGIGIDSRYHDRIFGIFQRLNEIEEVDGTGVGLAIAKKIVEAHLGTIRVESQKGEGATFYFTLPKRRR